MGGRVTCALDQAGKGLFLRWLTDVPSAELLARKCAAAGIEWVAPLVLWQELPGALRKTRGRTLDPAAVAALRARDITVIPWAYIVPGGAQEAVVALAKAATICGHRTVILDAEAEWSGASADDVTPVGTWLSHMALTGALTSYGAPWWHTTFPWARWADVCPWGLPQVYDGDRTSHGPGYPARGVAAWAEWWRNSITPVSRAYSVASRGVRWGADELVELAEQTPMPAGSIGWWDVLALDALPERWRGVGRIEIRGRS